MDSFDEVRPPKASYPPEGFIRAATAARLGADQVAASFADAARMALMIGNGGFDVVVECVGKTALYEGGLELVRPGGVLACFGLEQPDRRAKISPYEVVMREKSLVGSVGATGKDMRDALDLLLRGDVDVSPYTEATFRLEDVDLALNAFAIDRVALKVQIAF